MVRESDNGRRGWGGHGILEEGGHHPRGGPRVGGSRRRRRRSALRSRRRTEKTEPPLTMPSSKHPDVPERSRNVIGARSSQYGSSGSVSGRDLRVLRRSAVCAVHVPRRGTGRGGEMRRKSRRWELGGRKGSAAGWIAHGGGNAGRRGVLDAIGRHDVKRLRGSFKRMLERSLWGERARRGRLLAGGGDGQRLGCELHVDIRRGGCIQRRRASRWSRDIVGDRRAPEAHSGVRRGYGGTMQRRTIVTPVFRDPWGMEHRGKR